MSMRLNGSVELRGVLAEISQIIEDNGGNSGVAAKVLRAGAEPIEAQILANASSDPAIRSGTLHAAIKTGGIKGGGNRSRITIGVHKNEADAFYASFVEYGHGGPRPARPHPFVRPAYDAQSDAAYQAMRSALADALARTIK